MYLYLYTGLSNTFINISFSVKKYSQVLSSGKKTSYYGYDANKTLLSHFDYIFTSIFAITVLYNRRKNIGKCGRFLCWLPEIGRLS